MTTQYRQSQQRRALEANLLRLCAAMVLTAPAFLAAASISAQAETLHVTWVEPAEPSLNESWDQSSNPTPSFFALGSETDVPVTNSNPSGISVVFFFSRGQFGLGGFEDSLGLVNAAGDQVYSGPESSPVFAPGSFSAADINENMGTLTFTAVPEPSTWAMMLLGFAGLGFAGWRARGGFRLAA
jgi:hypothetical protein